MLPPFLSPYFRAVQNYLPRCKWCRRWSQKRDIRYNKGSRHSQAREHVKPLDLWELGLYLLEWRRLSCGSLLHRLWTKCDGRARSQRDTQTRSVVAAVVPIFLSRYHVSAPLLSGESSVKHCGAKQVSLDLAKPVVINLIGLLKYDRRKVCPAIFQISLPDGDVR